MIGADGAATPRQLTGDSRYRDEEPLWSKDGGYILFCRMDANDHKSLWLMRADGGGATPIAESLYTDPGLLGVDGTWFGYYGYIDWRSADYATGSMFDWYRG